MPKSRQNKDRKQNLEKFKNQHKKNKLMSENNNQMPEVRQIRQVPTWAQDAKFELNGSEFMALQNFFQMFAEPVSVMQGIFARNIESGTIQIRYQDPQGTEIPKEEVDAYLKQMQDYFATQNATPLNTSEAEAPKKLKPSKSKATSTEVSA